MLFKPDWPDTRERHVRWWAGEMPNQPLIQILAPRDEPLCDIEEMPAPDGLLTDRPGGVLLAWIETCNVREKWCEPVFPVNRLERQLASLWYGYDAVPDMRLNTGPTAMASYITDYLHFNGDTAWLEVQEPWTWDQIHAITYNPKNSWWRVSKQLAGSLAATASGRFIVGMPDISGPLDILACLRTTNGLLVDLLDATDDVKNAVWRLTELFFEYYDQLFHILKVAADGGTSAWINLWAPGRGYPLQCDFAAMISPEMFGEIVAPHLTEQCRRLEYPVYHLCGPGQIRHLDHLLAIEALQGIQWSPGAGAAPMDDPEWFPMYNRIQKAGKKLILKQVPEKGMLTLLDRLSPAGLMVRTMCQTEDNGKQLLDTALARY